MKRASLVISALLAATLFSGSCAYSAPRILTGEVSQERVAELNTQIPWYRSLNQAETVAQQQGKLIFWVHMLGTLDGAT